jgi:hypothetical protein
MDMLREMAILIEHPLLALVPAALFAALFAKSKSRIVLATLVLWLAYLPYEYGMKLRILCSGECNIRIDLLVLYPALILVSLIALVVFTITVWRKSHA